jgi:hypothetical protein
MRKRSWIMAAPGLLAAATAFALCGCGSGSGDKTEVSLKDITYQTGIDYWPTRNIVIFGDFAWG